MPLVFKPVDISLEEKECRKDYFDRHTPFVVCQKETKRNEKFKVKVTLGDQYTHPDDYDHYISTVQLWNRETLLAQVFFTPGALGNQPGHVEVDFYVVPKMTMNLTAMAVCTKHGFWESETVDVKVVD